VLRVLVLAAAVVAAPLPSLAEEASPPAAAAAGLRVSVEKAVAAEAAALAQPPAFRAQQEGGTDLGSKSYFRTRAGVITLVLVGVGLGYALYSTSNDRVKSPAR
jgi:hypothetical protein